MSELVGYAVVDHNTLSTIGMTCSRLLRLPVMG
jgi:hypothetical protein